jgi:RNA-directed DNA polymerase
VEKQRSPGRRAAGAAPVPSTGVPGRSGAGQVPAGKPFAITREEVWRAWEKVRENKGAPGVDEVSIAEFEVGLHDNLYKVWNRMSSGSYFPPPVKGVEIPKAGGGARLLGVPAIADRVAQTVAAARVEAIVEPVFHDDSFGYRPRRGVTGAVGRCRDRCWKYDWVVDLDVQRFFDTVPWDKILAALEKHQVPSWVILYVKRWLAAPVQMPDGSLQARDKGTPQGSAISPVLANLFMHYAFDVWMARHFPDCPFERYADDAVVHCASQERARQVLAALEQRMSEVGLRLHPDKTRVVYCKDDNRRGHYDGPVSFDFLGFTFRARSVSGKRGRFTGFSPAVSAKNLARMSREVRNWRLARRVSLSWRELAAMTGPVIRGWMNSYGRFYRSALYPLLARINYHIQQWVRAKYKKCRPVKAMLRAWEQVITCYPGTFPHWRWVTWAWR